MRFSYRFDKTWRLFTVKNVSTGFEMVLYGPSVAEKSLLRTLVILANRAAREKK